MRNFGWVSVQISQKTRLLSRAIALFLAVGASGAGLAESETAEEAHYEFSADWTTRYHENWLIQLGSLVGQSDVHGLEIGCFEARSTIWFLEHITTHPTARMTCIDVFTEAIERRFDHNLRVSGLTDRMS